MNCEERSVWLFAYCFVQESHIKSGLLLILIGQIQINDFHFAHATAYYGAFYDCTTVWSNHGGMGCLLCKINCQLMVP